MSETILHEKETPTREPVTVRESDKKLAWETPRMEDVSEQVTAQPYIRFT